MPELISIFIVILGFPLILPVIWGAIQFINVRQSAYRLRQWRHFAHLRGLSISQRRIPSRWRFSPDLWPYVEGEYAGHFLKLRSYAQGLDTFTELSLTAATPPPGTEADLAWLRSMSWSGLKGWISAEPGGRQLSYRQGGFEGDPQRLEQLAELLIKTTAAYASILKLGALAVPTLQSLATGTDYRNYPIRLLARQLLRDIAQDTYTRLGGRPYRAICRRCLTYPGAHQVALTLTETLSYCGCRTCRQSQDFWCGQVVAVLDPRMEVDVAEREGRVEVNWLRLQTLFDFDEVEIRQATDEQVERFMMQIGNDTDPFRRPHYQRMNCTVGPDCELSINSLKLLERFLGKVNVSSQREAVRARLQEVSARRIENATHLDHESSDTQTLHAL